MWRMLSPSREKSLQVQPVVLVEVSLNQLAVLIDQLGESSASPGLVASCQSSITLLSS